MWAFLIEKTYSKCYLQLVNSLVLFTTSEFTTSVNIVICNSQLTLENEAMRSLLVFVYMFIYAFLEKEMATHSSTLAWRIPWTEEPGGLQSTGSLRVGHD